MTDFDEIFKEKVESKQYKYSHKAWKSFSKKAKGTGMSLSAKIGIGLLATGATLGLGTLVYNHVNSGENNLQNTNNQQVNNNNIIIDSAVTEQEKTENLPLASEKSNKSEKKIINVHVENKDTVSRQDTLANETRVRKAVNQTWKINIINVDTIK